MQYILTESEYHDLKKTRVNSTNDILCIKAATMQKEPMVLETGLQINFADGSVFLLNEETLTVLTTMFYKINNPS